MPRSAGSDSVGSSSSDHHADSHEAEEEGMGRGGGKRAPSKRRKETATKAGTFTWLPWSIWRRLFFLEVDPLIRHAYRTRLEPGDSYQEASLKTENLVGIFEPAWEAQLEKEKPDLRRAVVAGNLQVGRAPACTVLYSLVLALVCTPKGGVSMPDAPPSFEWGWRS
jgi:hypothetical protein